MRTLLFILLLAVSGFSSDTRFNTYCNSRFEFCIQYPGSFIAQPESANHDGRTFIAADKKAEIRAFGSLVTEGAGNIARQFATATAGLKITTKTVKDSWFLFSGVDAQGNIVCRKTRTKRLSRSRLTGGTAYQSLMIIYPASQKLLYGSYCELISKWQ
ncbi:MAG: hypothetical protein JO301_11690 [Chitinophagaceae bacterium]|nr:hypothetical protein [Chitinophagaceae bacterium]